MLVFIAFAGICAGGLVGLMVASAKGLIGTSTAPGRVRAKSEHTLRVVTLNVAHGRGLAPNQALVESEVISDNLRETAHYLDALNADLVGLQEIDKNCNWSGNSSQVKYIAENAGFDEYFLGVNNRRAGRYQLVYGNALLTNYEVLKYQNYPFSDSSIGGKGYLVADVEVDDRVLTLCVVHLAPVGKRARRRQVRHIISTLETRDNPLVVMGDFNCELGGDGVLDEMCTALDLETVRKGSGADDTFRFLRGRRIDYIFSSRSLNVSNYHVGDAKLSDHRPVICDLHVAEEKDSGEQPDKNIHGSAHPEEVCEA